MKRILLIIIVTLLLLCINIVYFPITKADMTYNPLSVKFAVNYETTYPSWVGSNYQANIFPLSADVTGNSTYEIFGSFGNLHSTNDKGTVFCAYGHNGTVIWHSESTGYGSHTCLELFDVDGDGNLELLATGYYNITMFHAENGTVMWYDNDSTYRYDSPPVILRVDGTVWVYIAYALGYETGGIQKRYWNNGTVYSNNTNAVAPCHSGLSAEDLDGDGDIEIILTDRWENFTSGHGVQCYDTDLNLLWEDVGVHSSSHLANIIDIDGDNDFEVVAVHQDNTDGGVCTYYGNNGTRYSGKWDRTLSLTTHYTPSMYDVDQDGHIELLTAFSDGPGKGTEVWDMTDWSEDVELTEPYGAEDQFPPQIANVMNNSDMEIITAVVNTKGVNIYDKNYSYVGNATGTSYATATDRMCIQDIDGDGLNEIITLGRGTSATLYCYETEGTCASPQQRTENFGYSLRRNFVAKYVPAWNVPVNSDNSPINGATGTSLTPTLTIKVSDADANNLMNVTFRTNATGTWGDIGTNSSVANPSWHNWTNASMNQYNTKYWWSVNTSNGWGGWDNDSYSFTTVEEQLNTSVDSISPYSVSTSLLDIIATAYDMAPENVSLWYRYSTDNSSWGGGGSENWYDTDFSYRKVITINSSRIDATLTNFPVLISLYEDSNLSNNAQPDGDDIFFVLYSDNTTKLNHEIEDYSSSGTLTAWVNVTSLSGSVDTKLWMYYGNTTCSSQENVIGTWDSNYIAVYHWNDDFTDSAGASGWYNGTGNGGIGFSSSGLVASCLINTDATESDVTVSEIYSFVDQTLTAEIFVNFINNNEPYPVIWMQGPAYNNQDWGFYHRTPNDQEFRLCYNDVYTTGGNLPGDYGVGCIGFWFFQDL